MTSSLLINVFIIIFFIGLIVFNVFRIILARRIRKQELEYEKMIEKKLKSVHKDLQQRTIDLKESIDMINHEYSNVMKSMESSTKTERKELEKKIKDYKKKLEKQMKQQGITPKQAIAQGMKAKKAARQSTPQSPRGVAGSTVTAKPNIKQKLSAQSAKARTQAANKPVLDPSLTQQRAKIQQSILGVNEQKKRSRRVPAKPSSSIIKQSKQPKSTSRVAKSPVKRPPSINKKSPPSSSELTDDNG